MTEMQCVKFGEMAQQITTKVNPKDTSLDTYVGLEHLDTGSLRINRRGTPKDVIGEKLQVIKGDIIFGKRRVYQRKLAIADFDGICSAHAMVLRPKEDIVDKEFFPFFMQSDLFMERALQISVGSLSPTINWKTLAEQEFIIPPLPDQRRSATTLLAAEDCIIKGERFVAVAERAKQVLMGELINKDKGQDRKDWNIVRLGDICKTCTGGTPSRNQREFFGGSIPWFKSGELEDSIITSSEEKITSEGLENSNAKIFPKGTLLIALYGATTGKVGLLGIDASTNQAICAIFPNEKVNSKFLFYLLIQYRPSILLERCGAAQPNISQDIIRKMEISIPPLPEQRQIAGILTRCDETIAAARANVVAAKALKMKMINEMLAPL